MSHSITLFSELSLANKFLILINHSNQTNAKIRIRKSEILTKYVDTSGYKLGKDNKLTFLENHLNFINTTARTKILNQFLNEIQHIKVKSNINVEELQKTPKLNQSRIITAKLGSTII